MCVITADDAGAALVHAHADALVMSLTKYFSPSADVLAGAVCVNPASPHAAALTRRLSEGPLSGAAAPGSVPEITEIVAVQRRLDHAFERILEVLHQLRPLGRLLSDRRRGRDAAHG